MGADSKIEWTHHTWNPWRGCTKVSAGCANCYAETLSGRNPGTLGAWGPNGSRVVASDSMWREPAKWDKAAKEAGERHRVFCASMADVFEGPETMPKDAVLNIVAARMRLWDLITATPDLDWLLLTKRPQNVREMTWPKWWDKGWPSNVWVGASVENQQTADERIPHLLKIPAAVRFLSVEPLLGPVDLKTWLPNTFTGFPRGPRVDWVIVGGESGHNARPMCPDWATAIRDQCVSAGVPFHFKQHGEWLGWGQMTADQRVECYRPGEDVSEGEHLKPHRMMLSHGEHGVGHSLYRVGKKAAGRILDGRTWDEFPTPHGQTA